jgi:hypothetical protein
MVFVVRNVFQCALEKRKNVSSSKGPVGGVRSARRVLARQHLEREVLVLVLVLEGHAIVDPRLRKKRIVLEGEVGNPAAPPTGCYFYRRCAYHRAMELKLAGVD